MHCWVVVTVTSLLGLAPTVSVVGVYSNPQQAQQVAAAGTGRSVLTIELPAAATTALPSAG